MLWILTLSGISETGKTFQIFFIEVNIILVRKPVKICTIKCPGSEGRQPIQVQLIYQNRLCFNTQFSLVSESQLATHTQTPPPKHTCACSHKHSL